MNALQAAINKVNAYQSTNTIYEFATMPTSEIPFSQEVVDMCKSNRCGKYGTCWTCPPGVGTLEELKAKIMAYENAVVFTCKYDLEDSFDFEGMKEGAHKTALILDKILDELKKQGLSVLGLGCEGCHLCETCTYPSSPCRFPEKATPSVEACGIFVVELAKKLSIRYHNGTNTVTYFCVILVKE